MKNMLSPKLVLLLLLSLVGCGIAAAQDNPPPDGVKPPPQNNKPNLFRELGLSPDQMQQIRRINQERKPQMEDVMRRLREANRALDEAIYADVVDESAVQTRLKEVQIAQAEAARLRFMSELSIRKILTPDQLARFRELRRQFIDNGPKPQGPTPNDKARPGQQFVRPSGQKPGI